MPFTLKKEVKFEASHQLVGHDGKCQRLHGHSWVAVVELCGDALYGHGPKEGMLADFADVKKAVEPLVENFLDHHHLNETLRSERPTSEFVAQWLFEKLRAADFGPLARLVAVEVRETCTSACRYCE